MHDILLLAQRSVLLFFNSKNDYRETLLLNLNQSSIFNVSVYTQFYSYVYICNINYIAVTPISLVYQADFLLYPKGLYSDLIFFCIIPSTDSGSLNA